ncbi:hypothetical protein N0V83_003938 [Neocucurbitaria cava]|uniref:Ubiquitin-conjugating enzyme E2-binding protein n=1 Tax=Neocucurbitaria cava TaxID=798079 RepID=A0A9W8YAM2_9PLEO|nr:hypothetical protein N0V83_003938 [Neocucurbitaria cava]
MSRPLLPASAYEGLGLSPEAIEDLMNPKPANEPPKIAAPNLLQSDEDNARRMAPNETVITLYAELLLNIRTVTLFASLRTNYSHETKAKLSADGSYITISHEGQSATIRLPINVKGDGDAALSLPSQPSSKELTLRLQMEEREGSDLLGTLQGEGRQANVVPWDGGWLGQIRDLDITCKNCGAVIVPRGKIRQWRDLPNENWAEMMDFWHCHKPDEHHLHDRAHEEATTQKGYAAVARLLYLIENFGVRKFNVHPLATAPKPSSDPLSTPEAPKVTPSVLIWVFTPDLLFSSSIPSPQRHDPTRSMKVFYQKQSWQPLKPGDPESATVEDVEFPQDLFEDLNRVLEQSQGLLPPTTRNFQGWDVGLLERFDWTDVSKADGESDHVAVVNNSDD